MKIKDFKKLILLFMMISGISNGYSQNSFNAELSIKSYMEFIRNNNYAPALNNKIFQQENTKDVFNSLQSYYLDTLPKVRLKAYYISYKAGLNANTNFKNIAINKLISGCKDSDLGIVGICFDWLSSFHKNDFNKNAIDSISNLMERETAHYDKLLKMAGFLDLKEKAGIIRAKLNEGVQSEKIKWAAYLALARLGEQNEIDYILKRVKSLPVNDDLVYDVFPGLIYTRQKQVFNYLIKILHSNEKNCFSANPESTEKIICAYRIMEYLAPAIENFPIETDKWNDIVVDDYPMALKKVRTWFKEQNGNYTIKNNTY